MRLLHTSDWHLGRTLEGRSRLPEQEQFLTELEDIATKENVDLVLVAGDVFDTSNPPAKAEELYYASLEALCAGGTRAVVVIAGNHDNPERIRAANPLAARHGISLVGYPGDDLGPSTSTSSVSRVRTGQGWFVIHSPRCDQSAFIVTLAYPSEARLNEVIGESLEDKKRQAAYSDRVAGLVYRTLAYAEQDTVPVVLGHLYTSGCRESDSERQIQLGGALAVHPSAFGGNGSSATGSGVGTNGGCGGNGDSSASGDGNSCGVGYVALGHLHRPQKVAGSPAPCRYSGSPLAYSFSEADQQKEVVLVDLEKGRPTVVTPVKIASGRPLKRWAPRSLEEALKWCEDTRNANAWVDMELARDEPLTAGEISTLRAAHPGLINIRWVSTAQAIADGGRRVSELPLIERFKLFCRRNGGGAEPDQELLDLFLELVNQDEEEAPGQ